MRKLFLFFLTFFAGAAAHAQLYLDVTQAPYSANSHCASDLPEAIQLLEAVARPSDSSDAFVARIELGRIYSSGSDADNALRWYEAAVGLATEHDDSEDLREARAYIARTKL
jgi:hypothetical protein